MIRMKVWKVSSSFFFNEFEAQDGQRQAGKKAKHTGHAFEVTGIRHTDACQHHYSSTSGFTDDFFTVQLITPFFEFAGLDVHFRLYGEAGVFEAASLTLFTRLTSARPCVTATVSQLCRNSRLELGGGFEVLPAIRRAKMIKPVRARKAFFTRRAVKAESPAFDVFSFVKPFLFRLCERIFRFWQRNVRHDLHLPC